MCRGNDHGGRRCPADTSEARQLRRKNAEARTAYAPLATEPVESKALPASAPKEVTAEAVRSEIVALHNLHEEFRGTHLNKDIIQTAYDKQLNIIGANVWELAEQKYGAPSDEELKSIHDDIEGKLIAAADIEKAKIKAEVQILAEREKELRDKLFEHASPATHPNIADRNRIWLEEANDTLQEYRTVQRDGFNAEVRAAMTHKDVYSESIQAVKEGLEKRNAAMKAALSDVGVQFADPETLKFSEDSHKDAVASLKNALPYFPQQWVDNSNAYHQQTELRVKRSKGRAHYSSNREQTKRKFGTSATIDIQREEWQPDASTLEGMSYVDMKGEKVWVDPVSGHRQRATYVPEGYKTWAKLTYDYSETPKKGWEKVEYMKTDWNREQRAYAKTGEQGIMYRKIKKSHISTSWERKAELTVTRDTITRVGRDDGFRVAMHEFSHRVEHTTPVVAGYEDAFLSRRAGHLPQTNPSGEQETLTAIYEGKKEMGYKDNFPSHYMGKVYDHSYREIMSMGMETLFAGTNGAFVGMQGYKADPDYKKFILGVLASSSNRGS